MAVELRTTVAGIELPQPILAAAGCAGSGREIAAFCDLSAIGAITTRTITAHPRAGLPTPRLAETAAGVLSATGLPGPGVAELLGRDLPWLLTRGARTIVSIAGGGPDEFAALAGRLRGAPGMIAVEVNTSCPGTVRGGHREVFAADPESAAEVVAAVRGATDDAVPVLAKLPADTADVVALARACAAAGADGLTLIDAPRGLAIAPGTLRPALGAGIGGLSGPAILPIAVRCVWQVRAALPRTAIIGVGGVSTGEGALQMIAAGADAVGVGTALLADPAACTRITRELTAALEAHGARAVAEIVSAAHRPRGAPIARHAGRPVTFERSRSSGGTGERDRTREKGQR